MTAVPGWYELKVITEAACAECGRVRRLRGKAPQKCSGCYSRTRREAEKRY